MVTSSTARRPSPRTPAEIAQGILDHAYSTPHERMAAKSFGEALLEMQDADSEYGKPLHNFLTKAAGNAPLTHPDKAGFAREALTVLKKCTAESEGVCNILLGAKRVTAAPAQQGQGTEGELGQTRVYFASVFANLATIEAEIRTLARALGIELVEVERGK